MRACVKGVGIPYVVFVICFGKGIGFSLTWNRNRFSSVNADKHLYVREQKCGWNIILFFLSLFFSCFLSCFNPFPISAFTFNDNMISSVYANVVSNSRGK